MTLIVKISDLSFLPEFEASEPSDDAKTAELIRKHFGFLASDICISVKDGIAVIEFSEPTSTNSAEAQRLARKASQKAIDGEYARAVEFFRRALALNPAMPDARRDLAMSLYELGDMESAKNELLDALRLQPGDVGSLVVLGNIYVRHEKDYATAEKLFSRALEIKADDAHALNSMAAVQAKLGKSAEALTGFDKAIHITPTFPNSRLGKALLEHSCGRMESASESLRGLFLNCDTSDARSRPVFAEARSMFLKLEKQLALQTESEAFKALENYKSETALFSGYPIECREDGTLDTPLSGLSLMAWKHGRDRHLIKTKPGLPPPDLLHVTAHEVTHILFESKARSAGRNRFFSTNEQTTRVSLEGLGNHISRLVQSGWQTRSAEEFLKQIYGFVCASLFNTPLDFYIETEVHERLPELRHAQFVSLHRLAEEAYQAIAQSHGRREIPVKFLESVTALNATSALFLDDLSDGATAFWPRYSHFKGAQIAPELFRIWKSRKTPPTAGAEYDLVDQFAKALRLEGWYKWIPDTGTHSVIDSDSSREGASNRNLLLQKHPAAVWHLLDALLRFDGMETEKIREVAFEIGKIGQEGIDYSDPANRYTLRSIPGESFSGLQMMCLMFAGFKRIAPDLDLEMDLNDPWLRALAIHNSERRKET